MPNTDSTNHDCACTYPGCPRHGKCRECIAYHRKLGQFTGCMFSKDGEKKWDRSLEFLIRDRKV